MRRFTLLRITSLVVAAFWLLQCALVQGLRRDRWFHAAEVPLEPSWRALDASLFSSVNPAGRDAAVAGLASVPWKKVRAQDGRGVPADKQGLTLYLLRALCVDNCKPQGFSVYVRDRDVLVSHTGVASRHGPTHRWAVVAWLPHPPRQVFVQCSAAE